ncbi:transglycosylase-like protein with SLT domain [Paracidovorax citrulli]|uniref:Lytic transglycosylase, catalytic n=2 Tax=Paracidovorax citrulli TaxID=80869 RepID=A1TQQ7_PARC0|nr:Lytic transglycosylase, catalytic [Paracidovorax citrulli AAC00-1]ATG92782.1 lytic transglycosylase domain-containing protein [Paracidovorax citrulli]PVY62912.1 transglycosylase-like protein with SLT domain [Paracidovorax citrulli]REG68104.1 transglycosylase-like protein with SLT domain [Paracidovorax citrulli]RLJ92664.1 transglycosylase-like protein with SLT domain [Paracidovorax citrulli]
MTVAPTRLAAVALALCLWIQCASAGPETCLRGHSRSEPCQRMLQDYWRHEAAITAIARHYGLEPALLKALVAVESGYNAAARSPANARGLTQVLPSTAAGVGLQQPEQNLYRPELALAAGAAYLRQMWFEFRAWDLALAAYNAGPGAVRKHGGIPPYRETQAYVPKVLALYREFALAETLAASRSMPQGNTP